MNAKTILCDDQRLLAMLKSDSPDDDQDELMRHVEQCSHCQRRIEELAASPDDWHKVNAALSDHVSGEEDEFTSDVTSRYRFSQWLTCPVTWTESMARQILNPPAHPEMLGRLGRYEVERLIGAGGMGVVFKAFDSELNRPVAIKILSPLLAGSGSARRRFAREARAAAAIVHEHVVPIHNVETERDLPFLVMQFVPGDSLQSRINRTGPMQICEILRIGMQIASGLSAAHQQGLVHRDIKPSNILLEESVERALITDFGLARAADDATLTRSGFHPGTPQFMSPEQAAGEQVDTRSDLFSLGSVLYTMATGRPPFRADSSLGVLRRIADDEPRNIREINPAIPDWLCGIIGRLMAKNPTDRYRSAADVAAVLKQCLAHVQQPQFNPLPDEAIQLQTVPSIWCFVRSRLRGGYPQMSKVIGTSLVLAGLVAAYFLRPSSDSERLAALQGEWQLVSLERDGVAADPKQLFNERLKISGSKFARHQTAPDGTEIKAESGNILVEAGTSFDRIDFELWQGTIYGVYRLHGANLELCLTKEGGERPAAFQTETGSNRVLQTFRRKSNPDGNSTLAPNAAHVDDPTESKTNADKQSAHEWTQSWLEKAPKELTNPIDPQLAENWLRKNGFEDIKNAEITLTVMNQIHPNVSEADIRRDGIRSYVHGILRSEEAEHNGAAIEVYCLFGEENRLLAVHVGSAAKPQTIDLASGSSRMRRLPQSQPVFADLAPVIACIGPAHPVRLGDIVSHADISDELDQSVVRLHVWDWSESDISRILLIQRSELGALSPDGTTMVTPGGETIDLMTKKTRQYSGFRVPDGQRITSLQISPSKTFVAACIESIAGAEGSDANNKPRLRLLKLDAATNTGQVIWEYSTDQRMSAAFAPDEQSLIYLSEEGGIIRRDTRTGTILNTYQLAISTVRAVSLGFSPDGRYVAAAGGSKAGEQNVQESNAAEQHVSLHVWNTIDGRQVLQQVAIHPFIETNQTDIPRILTMRFSPDSRILLFVSGDDLRLLDIETGTTIAEHRDTTRSNFVHADWTPDSETISLQTSSELLALPNNTDAERLPRNYQWNWKAKQLDIKTFAASEEGTRRIVDPDIESQRLSGTWRVVDRSLSGVEQTAEIGTTFQILNGRMDEVRLDLDPNQTPSTVDVVFLDGPDQGKVLRGIYEWISRPATDKSSTGRAIRICTFVTPNLKEPDLRPAGFQAGKNVDTAVWEQLSR
ncbi:MAG: protein kinase [Planctomyces sp.]|nr:protein kinase [Planctomyces sp.]